MQTWGFLLRLDSISSLAAHLFEAGEIVHIVQVTKCNIWWGRLPHDGFLHALSNGVKHAPEVALLS